MAKHEAFYKAFVGALEAGGDAVFVGAGVSRAVGYPDWRGLLRDIAAEVNLNIDNEHDLAGIAQYSLNAAGLNRTKLAQLIKDTFLPTREPPLSLQILARLAPSHIWTTNYDELIERSFAEQSRSLEVKSKNEDLPLRNIDAETILFKMHGTVSDPTKVVIATDDYELYLHTRAGFAKSLDSDFINRTFLFMGLSFNDPNLSHLFSMARSTFYTNTPEHFAILRSPQASDFSSTDEYEYKINRHKLWIDDFAKRYNIQVVGIDDYAELSDILAEVERRAARRNVLVSGSYPQVGGSRLEIESLAKGVGRSIASVQGNIVCGVGQIVGGAAITGFIDGAYHNALPSLNRRMILRPFPQGPFSNTTREAVWRRFREEMVRQSGAVILIAGLRDDGTRAEGVFEEYEIAKALGRDIFPIPIVGTASYEIFKEVINKRREADPRLIAILRSLDPNSLTETSVQNAVADWLALVVRSDR